MVHREAWLAQTGICPMCLAATPSLAQPKLRLDSMELMVRFIVTGRLSAARSSPSWGALTVRESAARRWWSGTTTRCAPDRLAVSDLAPDRPPSRTHRTSVALDEHSANMRSTVVAARHWNPGSTWQYSYSFCCITVIERWWFLFPLEPFNFSCLIQTVSNSTLKIE